MPREFTETVDIPETISARGLTRLWILLEERVKPTYTSANVSAPNWTVKEDSLLQALDGDLAFDEVNFIMLTLSRGGSLPLSVNVFMIGISHQINVSGEDEQEVVGLAEILRRWIAKGGFDSRSQALSEGGVAREPDATEHDAVPSSATVAKLGLTEGAGESERVTQEGRGSVARTESVASKTFRFRDWLAQLSVEVIGGILMVVILALFGLLLAAAR